MLINILQQIIWPKMSIVMRLRDTGINKGKEEASHSRSVVGEGSFNTVDRLNFLYGPTYKHTLSPVPSF